MEAELEEEKEVLAVGEEGKEEKEEVLVLKV